ncbi:hypothetical protein EJ357_28410 [Streptomyces cyaneochromogenes]|uniref:Uncharacterized protein n=1 Tax=Streptomyces cyaneochromogenes TaxID=2496836 RepID=A0A3Q9EVV5_9ACTN|nr:hypothetical protein [Streptomyces cyaneochromogenes]AZQ36891.1 hypothetical protein EJ357_28410 [Streptomyces cyaneochromogenes]
MTAPHPTEVDAHLEQLRAALAANGITLPSLRVNLPSLTALPARPLIALGNCNLVTAEALTAALRRAADR